MVEYVYTLSSRRGMPSEYMTSIKSLLAHVNPSEVRVIFTPPIDEEDVKDFEKLGVKVQEKDNQTEEVQFKLDKSRFAEKIQACSIQDDEIIFLDCDTLVLEDPTRLLEGSFDIKFRLDDLIEYDRSWEILFQQYRKPLLPKMPNTGLIVFKNGFHREIRDEWLKYIEEVDYRLKGQKHQEQYALALAVSDKNYELMDSWEHSYGFRGEIHSNTVVRHGYEQDEFKRQVKSYLMKKFRASLDYFRY